MTAARLVGLSGLEIEPRLSVSNTFDTFQLINRCRYGWELVSKEIIRAQGRFRMKAENGDQPSVICQYHRDHDYQPFPLATQYALFRGWLVRFQNVVISLACDRRVGSRGRVEAPMHICESIAVTVKTLRAVGASHHLPIYATCVFQYSWITDSH